VCVEKTILTWLGFCFITAWIMNKTAKIVVLSVLAVGMVVFASLFFTSYGRFMDDMNRAADRDQVEVLTQTGRPRIAATGYTGVMVMGAFFVVFTLGFGIYGAHELTHFISERTVKHLYDDVAEVTGKDYDAAEDAWANGNYLEAISMMRDYLKQNPRQVHVAIRIAEIYEKDLKNHLAAALEYEEVLKSKLAPEQWAWMAIHLCNLYMSGLNQKDKAIALLLRIDAEYGQTTAADKARKRLAMFATEAVNSGELTGVAAEPIEEIPPPPAATVAEEGPREHLPLKKTRKIKL
jgi:hypothetical protein